MHSGNPQAAVQMVISLLQKHSPNEVAELMGISVRWVYTLRKRYLDSNGNLASCLLKRGPASPMPNRTPLHIEELVINLAKETNLGPQRLADALKRSCGVSLSPFTVRNILRRYGVRCRKYKSLNGNRRYAANLSEFSPFEFWQIDAKHIADQSALPKDAYAAIFRNKLPQYQFTAIDIKTRLRFIAYAHSLSFANGLAFMLLVASWLRAFGVNRHMFFQTDNGMEFGGKASSRKRHMMQSFIFDPLNVSLLNIPPGQKQANSYVERSHRTDDEEFYALNLSLSTSVRSFLNMAQNWICHYNYERPHFGSNMAGKTPVEAIRYYRSLCHPAIGAMPVVVLDRLAVHISDLFRLNQIPWDHSPRNIKKLNETQAYYKKIYWEVMLMTDPMVNPDSASMNIDPADIEKNKVMAGLAYLIFFLPLLACPDSKYGRYHANQALILLIVGFGGSLILSFIPIIGWLLLPVFAFVVLVFAIIGLVNGFGGKVKPLPLIGKFTIIK